MTHAHDVNPTFLGLTPSEGSAYWTLGLLMVVKVPGLDVGGRHSVSEFLCPPGLATPLHLHQREDETWWVLAGRVRFRCGEEVFEAEPGACVYLPRGIPHGFKVMGAENARMLDLSVPAGAEKFHAELGVPAEDLTVPSPAPVDIPQVIRVGKAYGIEIVGPPID